MGQVTTDSVASMNTNLLSSSSAVGLDVFQVFYTHCQSILQKVFTPDTERTSISAKLKVHIL